MPFKHWGGRKNGDQPDLFDSTPSYRGDVEEFIQTWNKHIWLPRMQSTPLQAREVRQAMARPYFKEHWRESFAILAKSSFVWQKMRPRFKLAWFLIPDNFDKLMEGKYLDEKHQEAFFYPDKQQTTTRNGYDEEII